MTTVTLSSKNQVTLPSDFRKALKIKPGDFITFVIEGNHAVVRSVPKSNLLEYSRSMRGKFKGLKVEVRKILTERARKRFGKKG